MKSPADAASIESILEDNELSSEILSAISPSTLLSKSEISEPKERSPASNELITDWSADCLIDACTEISLLKSESAVALAVSSVAILEVNTVSAPCNVTTDESILESNEPSAAILKAASSETSWSTTSIESTNVETSDSILESNELSATTLFADSNSILVFNEVSATNLTFSSDETLAVNEPEALFKLAVF